MSALPPYPPAVPDSPVGGGRSPRARALRLLPLILCGGLVAYFQLKDEPSFWTVRGIPVPVARFFDTHDFLKNAIGFGVLALAVHFALLPGNRRALRRQTLLLYTIVVVLEVTQIFFPLRHCDWRDIAAGWLGISMVGAGWRWFLTDEHGR